MDKAGLTIKDQFGSSLSLILYLDSDLVVINKPSGLLSIRDGYDENLPHLATYFENILGRVWIIHRLDKETSGVMILARNADSHRYFNQEFRTRNVTKKYHCLVAGHPDWTEFLATFPLRANADRRHRTRIDPINGKPAKTGFKILHQFKSFSLVECELFTGYTHQIRAHLYALGLTIIQDNLYRLPHQPKIHSNLSGLDHIALHSREISFNHPVTNKSLSFVAPYPQNFQDFLSA